MYTLINKCKHIERGGYWVEDTEVDNREEGDGSINVTSSEGKQEDPNVSPKIVYTDELGKYRYQRGRRVYCCIQDGCTAPRIRGRQYCRHHGTEDTLSTTQSLPNDLRKELRVLKRAINIIAQNAHDPKILNRINDVYKQLSDLNDKFRSTVTKIQLKQLGFYFCSILFNYIPDGNRYEMAKKDFLDAIDKSGTYRPEDFKGIIK